MRLHDVSVASIGGPNADVRIVNNGGRGVGCDGSPAAARLNNLAGATSSGNVGGDGDCPTSLEPVPD